MQDQGYIILATARTTLTDMSDARGHVFWDRLNGRRGFDVIECDDGCYIDAFDSKTSQHPKKAPQAAGTTLQSGSRLK